MVGYPEYTRATIYNSAALITDGAVAAIHRKAELPNYKVFDEKRYFHAGAQPTVVECKGFRVGLLVCEDIWEPESAQLARSDRAELLVVINASPYETQQAARARGSGPRARSRRRSAARVRQHGGRAGRAGVRRQLLRDGCARVKWSCAPPPSRKARTASISSATRSRAVPVPGDVAPGVERRGERLRRAGTRGSGLR